MYCNNPQMKSNHCSFHRNAKETNPNYSSMFRWTRTFVHRWTRWPTDGEDAFLLAVVVVVDVVVDALDVGDVGDGKRRNRENSGGEGNRLANCYVQHHRER